MAREQQPKKFRGNNGERPKQPVLIGLTCPKCGAARPWQIWTRYEYDHVAKERIAIRGRECRNADCKHRFQTTETISMP